MFVKIIFYIISNRFKMDKVYQYQLKIEKQYDQQVSNRKTTLALLTIFNEI